MCILGLVRKWRLRKDASKTETRFVPLDRIRSLAVVMDVSGHDFEKCRTEILRFCKSNKIELTLVYLDFNGRMVTDSDVTVFRKDLNIIGKPSRNKVGTLLGKEFDCFICLSDSERFCVEYISKAIDAKQKIGIRELPQSPYELTVAPSSENREPQHQTSQKELFLAIIDILDKIR